MGGVASNKPSSATPFVVSARKYRPLRFEDVVGQQGITQLLEQAIAQDKVPHAMLFCGPRGVGKTSCARIFSYVVNGFTRTDAVHDKVPLSIFELDAASNNSVEDIRTLTAQVHIPPQQGRYKVYIIDEVHMLSRAAFNAFLKTLEEPPAHAIFILATTEKYKILPTVLSRCQLFHFKRVGVVDMVAHLQRLCGLQGLTIEEAACYLVARKADGSLRDALTLLDMLATYCAGSPITLEKAYAHLEMATDAFFLTLAGFLHERKLAQALTSLDEALGQGMDVHHLIISFCEVLRGALLASSSETRSLLQVGKDQQGAYEAAVSSWGVAFVLDTLQALNACEQTLYLSRYPRLQLELTLARCCAELAEGVVAEKKKS